MPYSENLEALHRVCNAYAPTGKEQRGFSRIRREAESDPDNKEVDVVRALCSALLDGLQFDNWPTEESTVK